LIFDLREKWLKLILFVLITSLSLFILDKPDSDSEDDDYENYYSNFEID